MSETFYWPVRVYYEDTDAQGIVYYANYLRFKERARTEWLRSLGIEQDALRAEENRIFVVVDTVAHFGMPARFNDELQVGVRLKERARASFLMEQNIYRDSPDGDLICSGETRAACLNATTRKPARLPAAMFDIDF